MRACNWQRGRRLCSLLGEQSSRAEAEVWGILTPLGYEWQWANIIASVSTAANDSGDDSSESCTGGGKEVGTEREVKIFADDRSNNHT